jgi:two-component sensor histidine kinase
MRPIIPDSFERATAIPHYEVAHSKRNASLELLVRELQHRIRNLLTVVQCFVNSTEARTADDYRIALVARLANLSDERLSHTSLFRKIDSWPPDPTSFLNRALLYRFT